MSEPFIAEIKMFAGNFNPRNYAFCDGQLLQISQNTALFSLVGTIYGGDGRTTLGLPDLKGRSPMHEGQGSGLSQRNLGGKYGTQTTTLSVANMPSHNHPVTLMANANEGNSADPTGKLPAGGEEPNTPYNQEQGSAVAMAPGAASSSNVGNSSSFGNEHPVLVINFIIALVGVFPSRN